jgi:hypothetical protein
VVSTPLAAALAVRVRHLRRRSAHAALTAGCVAPHREYHLPPTIEAAEREMAVLLRRMRAYLRDPYDFSASRINGEAAFEECLDRAATLGIRIAELGGAASADLAERDRMRGLILEGLTAGRRIATSQTAQPPRDRKDGGTVGQAPAIVSGQRAQGRTPD